MSVKINVPCRFSYLNCWEPKLLKNNKMGYSVSAIIPKSDKATIKKIKDTIEQIKEEDVSVWGGKVPSKLKIPLRDGDIDRPDDEAYANSYFFNAWTTNKPQVVDRKVQPIIDQSEVYSGCYGNISVNFYAYNHDGSKGIAAGLRHIQKLKDGESLGGITTAAEDFDTVEDDDFLS